MVTEVIADVPLLPEILYMEHDPIDLRIDHKEAVFKQNGGRHLALQDLIHFITVSHNLEYLKTPLIINLKVHLTCSG
jgi:hypothetical protein